MIPSSLICLYCKTVYTIPVFADISPAFNIRRELTERDGKMAKYLRLRYIIFYDYASYIFKGHILCDGRYGRLHSLTLDMRLVNTSYYLPITTLSDDMKTPKLISKNITGTLRRSSICFLSMVHCFLQKA